MMIPIATASLPTHGDRAFGAQRADHRHNGIDLAAREGTPVRAVADGIVRFATREWVPGFSGYGRVVVLEHPTLGTWTLYAHLAQPAVDVGQLVAEGQDIGTVGRTQYSRNDHGSMFEASGAHLHFEVSDRPYPQSNNVPRIDPVAWLTNAVTEPIARPNTHERKETREAAIPFGVARESSRCSLLCPSCGSSLVLEVAADE